jgi:hypothetical protein
MSCGSAAKKRHPNSENSIMSPCLSGSQRHRALRLMTETLPALP